MANVRIKRGTRAQIEAAAAGGTLADGEPYLITDEGRIAVGTGTGTFSAMATQEEMETFANVAIRTPSNALPLNMATGVDPDEVTLTGSAYNSLRGNAMAALHVQISTAPDFIAKLIDTGDIAGSSTSYAVDLNALPGLSEIYWQVRYKDVAGEYSAWSVHTSFVTAKRAGDYIATPTATPSAFGDPLDGGFYAGMIWNELTESSTSTGISTGEKTFVVSDMSVVPLVYHGQTLEIRSRANPANKMTGTVVSAIGTSLKISVTAVGGGGSFADWSIMSRFRVVVAPKASGQNNSVVYKNTATAAPVACKTLSEGFKATVTAPRVTADQIQSLMDRVVYHYEQPQGTTSTFAHAFLDGFYLASGYSACVSAANFDAAKGQKYAKEQAEPKARDKLWELEGYTLHSKLTQKST